MLVAPLTAAGMVLFALIWPSLWQFFAGCTTGMLMTMYMCLIDSPPEWIDRKRRGRDGERRTERRLRPLERRGWRVVHDIDKGRGNIDHVVVGPPGAYLLETKHLTGEASVAAGVLTIKRGDDERDLWASDTVGSAVKSSAVALRNELVSAAGIHFVQGVVVLWCDFPQEYVESESVVYLHGDRVHDWLYNQPPRLAPGAVAQAGDRLDRAATEGLRA